MLKNVGLSDCNRSVRMMTTCTIHPTWSHVQGHVFSARGCYLAGNLLMALFTSELGYLAIIKITPKFINRAQIKDLLKALYDGISLHILFDMNNRVYFSTHVMFDIHRKKKYSRNIPCLKQSWKKKRLKIPRCIKERVRLPPK